MIEMSTLSPDKLTANGAELYTYTCTENGHFDWRLPRFEEVTNFDTIWNQTVLNRWGDLINSRHCLLVRDL